MEKSSKISADDKALFRKAVGNTAPLVHDNIIPDRPKPAPRPLQTEADNYAVMQALVDSEFDESVLERGDELLFARPGIQKQTLKKLRRGQFAIEAELDLHGMTVEVARNALSEFLKKCMARSQRCVRIVHGKGLGSINKQPIIKNKVNNWLRQRDEVLAYCSARQIDGGTGAIYLLLKRI